jgi:hypothetical protein
MKPSNHEVIASSPINENKHSMSASMKIAFAVRKSVQNYGTRYTKASWLLFFVFYTLHNIPPHVKLTHYLLNVSPVSHLFLYFNALLLVLLILTFLFLITLQPPPTSRHLAVRAAAPAALVFYPFLSHFLHSYIVPLATRRLFARSFASIDLYVALAVVTLNTLVSLIVIVQFIMPTNFYRCTFGASDKRFFQVHVIIHIVEQVVTSVVNETGV